jgi:hypothetical protein
MTLTVPIPGKKDKIKAFYIPYDMMNPTYSNFVGDISLRESDTMATYRSMIAEKMELN